MADMLASPEDLASALKMDVDTATATLWAEVGTAVVQATAGQRIVRVVNDTVTIDLDPCDRSAYLDLPERPVVSVASATVGATTVTDFTPQLSRGRIWRSLGWRSATLLDYRAPSTATVVYTHGYLPTDQKIQLARGAVLSLVAVAYENPTGATSERIDDYAVAYAAAQAAMDASPALAALLRRQYGRPARSVKLVTT